MLGNLFRDQLDRYGEMEALADEWAKAVATRAGRTALVLNADDPLIADLGRDSEERPREGVVYFGIEDASQALPELQHAFDAKHCRRCGHPYSYERAFVGHLGHYSCPNCGADRPRPDVAATAIELRGMDGSSSTTAPPPARSSWSCRCRASTTSTTRWRRWRRDCGWAWPQSGSPPPWVRCGRPSAGSRRSRSAGVPVSILLIKNPAGANEVLRTLRLEAGKEQVDLWIALNDGIADGRDVSWVWDADFELLAGGVRRVVCAGSRAPEMALRLKYAGWPTDSIEVVPGIEASLDQAVAGAHGRLFALPTYTALLELRKLLAGRGLAKEFWR